MAVDHRFADLNPEREVLSGLPAEVDDLRGLSDDEVMARAAEAEGILLGARFQFGADRISQLRRCRVIVRYGVGVDNVDLERSAAAGIVVSYVPDYCVEEVSNHALALLLSLHRQLIPYDRRAREGRNGIDTDRPITRFSELTLGIVGFGRIGRELGRKARAFGVSVAAFDPAVPAAELEAQDVRPVSLDELLGTSDAVSLHLPLNPSTRGLLGAERLASMRPGAFVINVGRGGLIDEVALAEALTSGKLGGAGLDVTSTEPLPLDHPLLSAPNVILTPHVAWYSTGAQRELQTKAAQQVECVLSGATAEHAG